MNIVTKKFYPDEFKQSSAKLAIESEQSISQTARDLGIKPTTLCGWVKKYYPNYSTDFAREKSNVSALELENKQLRKELQRAKMERDILKKAVAYFAVETQ